MNEIYKIANGLEWLNTQKALGPSDLLGKIVLIDFWTYCCINCIHILPDLKKLEHEFAEELIVIGSHSAKFENEKDSAQIVEAIARYQIEHPVINDHEFVLWQAFGVRAWPSFVLLDAEGKYRGSTSGEGNYEILRGAIKELIKEAKDKKTLKPSRLPPPPTFNSSSLLNFPGKIDYSASTQSFWISDSNHHRILRLSKDGRIDLAIGSGNQGRKDGSFAEAEFSQPQGVVADGEFIYVADTSNHLIRRIDLKAQMVSTIAGTGVQGFNRNPKGAALKTPLASPWDLAIWSPEGRKILAIAMAGTHQLWGIDLKTNELELLAGSGGEDIVDGKASAALLAQPSGLYADHDKLYFADSETSSIRVLQNSQVKTLIGEGLFEFGLVDGQAESARLQHALGVTGLKDRIFIADTYNSAIRVLDLKTQKVSTLIKSGLNEPSDLIVVDNDLYIVDSNHHKISRSSLDGKLKEFNISIENQPTSGALSKLPFLPNLIELKDEEILENQDIEIKINLPKEYKINKKAPSSWTLLAHLKSNFKKINSEKLKTDSFKMSKSLFKDQKEFILDISVYYCRNEEASLSQCEIKSLRLKMRAAPRGRSSLTFNINN